jgi:hypothetical protein
MSGALSRAVADTMAYFGPRKEFLIGAPLLFLAASGISLYNKGDAAMQSIIEAASTGILAIVIVGSFLFLWNLACAPYRIERDRANVAEAKVAEFQNRTDAKIPIAHLGAMQRYEGTLLTLENRLGALSALVAQYTRLREASRQFYVSCGLPEDEAEVSAITKTIMGEMERFVLALPFAPHQGLRLLIGWNHFIQIFDVPKRVPPKINITHIPEGSHAQVKNVTTLSFEVQFWPENIQVTDFAVEADARL